MSRPTPETDTETMRDEYDHVDTDFGPFAPSDTVPADFARCLERERDEARGQWKEQHDALLTVMEHGENEMQKLIKERDEAIEARRVSAADWLSQVQNAQLRMNHALEMAAKCVKQFDEANCEKVDALQEVDLRTLDFERMKQERDEAIADRDIARLKALESDQSHDRMVGELEGVYKQLDEARERAAKLAEQLLAEMEARP